MRITIGVRSPVVVLRLEAAIPHGEQGAPLGYARPPRNGARRARIEVIVQRLNLPRFPVASEDVWEGGACKRRER
jgi:hypothetical protein